MLLFKINNHFINCFVWVFICFLFAFVFSPINQPNSPDLSVTGNTEREFSFWCKKEIISETSLIKSKTFYFPWTGENTSLFTETLHIHTLVRCGINKRQLCEEMNKQKLSSLPAFILAVSIRSKYSVLKFYSVIRCSGNSFSQ